MKTHGALALLALPCSGRHVMKFEDNVRMRLVKRAGNLVLRPFPSGSAEGLAV
jgi:hypothetical protein